MSELEEKMEEILEQNETSDITPPHRCLPPGHEQWIAIKTKRIFNLIQIEVDCPKCGGSGEAQCSKAHCDAYFYDINQGCGDSSGTICPVERKEQCPTCKGTGKITKPVESGDVGRII